MMEGIITRANVSCTDNTMAVHCWVKIGEDTVIAGMPRHGWESLVAEMPHDRAVTFLEKAFIDEQAIVTFDGQFYYAQLLFSRREKIKKNMGNEASGKSDIETLLTDPELNEPITRKEFRERLRFPEPGEGELYG